MLRINSAPTHRKLIARRESSLIFQVQVQWVIVLIAPLGCIVTTALINFKIVQGAFHVKEANRQLQAQTQLQIAQQGVTVRQEKENYSAKQENSVPL